MLRRSFLQLTGSTALAGAAGLASEGKADQYVRVSPRDPRYLELSDGSPYIPIGLNMIAPPRAQNGEAAAFATFESWLDSLAGNQGNYIRVWLSNPFWDVEHEKSGAYDGERARRIDRMLEMCQKRGIRVKMTMEHFRSIGEPPVRQPWADKPIHLVANGGPAKSIADFFDGEASRAQFREKIRWFSARYGSHPAVFGWELWNEINAVRGGDYLAWTEAMLPELHKVFPRNMAMQSLGSFDTDRVRENYRRHSLMPGNDLAQVHRYLDLGAALKICHGPVDVLAADSVRELLSYGPKRPVILAEGGAVEPAHTGPFKLYKADRDGIILHDVLFAPFFSGAAGPGQIWHWDAYVAANDLWWHYGRFADAVKGIDSPAEAFEPRFSEQSRFRVYALAGTRTNLMWIRDARNHWEAELQNGQAPETIQGASLEAAKLARGIRGPVRIYDPWTGSWADGTLSRGQIKLPAFSRSLVLRAGA